MPVLEFWYPFPSATRAFDLWYDLGPRVGISQIVEERRGTIQRRLGSATALLGRMPLQMSFHRTRFGSSCVSLWGSGIRKASFRRLLRLVLERSAVLPVEAELHSICTSAGGPLLHISGPETFSLVSGLRGIGFNIESGWTQMRVIHRSLFPDLERLARVATRWADTAWVNGDYLWMDFYWSRPELLPPAVEGARPIYLPGP